MQLNDEVSIVDTDYGKVLLNGRSGAYWELNPTGGFVLTELLAGKGSTDIAASLAKEYDVTTERAVTDVESVFTALYEAGLIRR
ncbi:lasso peptide biosynthesis PqqD family chaperone [Streptomyces sioyaensis]|uniref:lasso peptide biosynthesis PqqD family chaperone n=1 Tax=Streptomyces sioyaensis TaxID=67364 RepID=UPI00365F27AA